MKTTISSLAIIEMSRKVNGIVPNFVSSLLGKKIQLKFKNS